MLGNRELKRKQEKEKLEEEKEDEDLSAGRRRYFIHATYCDRDR